MGDTRSQRTDGDSWDLASSVGATATEVAARRLGLNVDWADLVYPGERNDVVAYLDDHGWRTTVHATPELYGRNGFEFPANRRWSRSATSDT